MYSFAFWNFVSFDYRSIILYFITGCPRGRPRGRPQGHTCSDWWGVIIFGHKRLQLRPKWRDAHAARRSNPPPTRLQMRTIVQRLDAFFAFACFTVAWVVDWKWQDKEWILGHCDLRKYVLVYSVDYLEAALTPLVIYCPLPWWWAVVVCVTCHPWFNWQDLHDDDKTCMQSSYWELILENGQ
jgi:hypothetical protein